MEYFTRLIKEYLIYEARLVLKKRKPKIIAIVGGVGKSTTKEALFTVLSRKYGVRKNDRSITSDIGIPFTILGVPYGTGSFVDWAKNIVMSWWLYFFVRHYPEFLILEIDGHNPHEINRLMSWMHIDILVITKFGDIPAHVESFSTPDNLAHAYEAFVTGIVEDGTLIYNSDDDFVKTIIPSFKGTKISFGKGTYSDICAGDKKMEYTNGKPVGMSFAITKPAYKDRIFVQGTYGEHMLNALVASMAVLQSIGEHPHSQMKLLQSIESLPGRMRFIEGLKGSVIIDDTYNSSPVALTLALSVLEKTEGKRKIAVLGDMLELGRFSVGVHKEFGQDVLFCDHIYLVGVRASFIGDGALEAGFAPEKISRFEHAEEAGKAVELALQSGDVVLVKGSQSMRMEKAVEEIMLHPEKKKKLLVRQEDWWVGK